MQFYKPNSKKTGHAIDLNFNAKPRDAEGVAKDGKLFIQFIKQTGWNDTTKRGSFKEGAKFNITLNAREIAVILNTIERNKSEKLFHAAEKGNTSIEVAPLLQGPEGAKTRNGITISVNPRATEGQAKEDVVKFGFWFDEAEARLLKEYLQFVLGHFFNADYSEQKAKRAAYSKKPKQEAAQEPEVADAAGVQATLLPNGTKKESPVSL